MTIHPSRPTAGRTATHFSSSATRPKFGVVRYVGDHFCTLEVEPWQREMDGSLPAMLFCPSYLPNEQLVPGDVVQFTFDCGDRSLRRIATVEKYTDVDEPEGSFRPVMAEAFWRVPA
jgi:hypothetical protein